MRRSLSSDFTLLFKLIVPIIWTGFILFVTVIVLLDSRVIENLALLIAVAPVLYLLKLRKIAFDNVNIYVSNWGKETVYSIHNLKALNEAEISRFDPFWQLEIRVSKNEIVKIEFLARINEQIKHQLTGELSGRLLELDAQRKKIVS